MNPPAIYTRWAPCAALQPLVRRPLAVWLADDELAELSRWRDAARRAQWIAGRALVKEMAATQILSAAIEPARICVVSAAQAGAAAGAASGVQRAGGGPRIAVDGAWQRWSLSLAHASGHVLAAIATTPGVCVGVDLTGKSDIDSRGLEPWLSPAEQQSTDRRDAARVWALKEAIYKAISRGGEPFTPGAIDLVDRGGQWECRVAGQRLAGLRSLEAWRVGELWAALAVVSRPPVRFGQRRAAASRPAGGVALAAASAEEAADVS